MDTYKEKEENSQPLPDFPLKWTPFHSCNSSYAATGLPFQNSSINSKSDDLPFNFSSSKSPVMADGITNDARPENRLTMPASPPKFVLEKSHRRVKLTARKSSRIASTDNVKKPTMADEQKTSKVGVNSTMKAQEEKRSDPMVGNLRPPKPPTTIKEIIIEEKGKEKALNQSKKKNNKPICADFNISLSPETIRNDLFVLTGERRLSRNSQRRPKNVQKNLDVRISFVFS